MFELAGFLLGLLLGSFLNVCISRLPEHRSISKPRSHCPNCLQTIGWYDNIPLLSWVLLRAKCRYCKERISWRYPLVELGVGLWAAFALLRPSLLYFGLARRYHMYPNEYEQTWILAASLFLAGFLLIGLMVMDWKTHSLPDAFTLTGIALGFFVVCVQAIFLPIGSEDVHFNPQRSLRMNSPGSFAARGDVFLTGPEHLVFGRLLAIVAAAAIPLLIRALYKAVRGREGMGLGDAKLLAMIAAFLGFWPAMLALFLGIISCAVWAAVLLARRRADLATRLPLGSFLAAGGLFAALCGDRIIVWYRGLL
jgi:leader peptidase (prepilin peptidase)/N-methyltransferase